MATIKVILQARMSSSRLPGKMLLPIAGIPLVVLCAKRATRNNRYDLVVATSKDESDDKLESTLKDHNIAYIRGDLDNVLERFFMAMDDMDDSDIIVRLTGDNPVVDADFIDTIVAHHKKSGAHYTRSLSPFDRLPYGVSAEVISVKSLRNLHKKSDISAFHREHVTSFYTIRDEYDLFTSPMMNDLSHLRMTVDTQEDYDRVKTLFETIGEDAITVSWKTLVESLSKTTNAFRTPYRKVGMKAQSRFALGTAQLGLPYGIANTNGQPDIKTAQQILSIALDHGVNLIDTAAAYGSSESVIGHALTPGQKQEITITTKLDPLTYIQEIEIEVAVKASIHNSCKTLGLTTLPYFLLHRWEHYSSHHGKIWQTLLSSKDAGEIQSLGASVQSPEEAIEALRVPDIKFIQLPFNICDWRWKESGFVTARAKRPDIHIQARSSLLQGVLTLPSEQWPTDHETAQGTKVALQNLAYTHHRESIQDLCYAYVRSQDWIDSIVVGVETPDQLLENLRLFNNPNLNDIDSISDLIPRNTEEFLNPALWPQR